MEVKPGYKQTDVGVIPEEWEVEKIGDLIEKQFILGHLDGNHGELYPRSHEFKSYGVPYVGANDFEEGNVTFERCKFLSNERAAKFRKGVARDGDVLFAHNATVGPVALLRTDFPFVILSTTATYFRCNPEKLSNSYLKGALQAQHFVRQYQAVMAQSTRFQVPITAQRKLSLVIAPLPEQRAIATALSDVDGLLGGLDRLIAKKRDLKQAAMQQLLTGQTRLPGFHGEWAVKTFGELFNFSGGYSASRDQLSSEGHCYLHYGDIHGATKTTVDVRADYQNIPKLDIPLKQVAAKSLLEDGDIVFVDASEDDEGASRHVVVVNKDKKPFISGLHTIVAKSKTDELAHEYRRYCFQTAAIRQQFLFYAVGTKVSGISKTNIAKLKTPVPKVSEQIAIAEVLTEMDAELAALELRREKTRALKQAMMQELLTGRTRLASPKEAHA
jgi:type I restriction enzyme S subunit